MSKRRIDWNEDKLKRFLAEGRGQGVGSNYRPWIQNTDFPSKGRSTRIFGWKTHRIHHLLTDSQTRYFYLLEWEDSVIDIREHFPLFNLEEIIGEKKDLNFNLFKDKDSGCNYILYTTFLITIKGVNGEEINLARSIKSSNELEKKIAIERLEIERRYWNYKGINWGIVTDKEIPVAKSRNIEWIHSSLYPYEDRGITKNEIHYLSDAFIRGMVPNANKPIRKYTTAFDKENNLELGTGLFVFKYLIASKIIKVDMNREININNPIGEVIATQVEKDKVVEEIC